MLYNLIMKSVTLDLVATEGCQICRAFEDFWHSVEKDWLNVVFRKVDLLTPEGQELVQKHMIFASPGIILNGELFQVGGFDREKFVSKLKELSQ